MRKSFFMAIAIASVMVSCTTTDETGGVASLTSDASGKISSYISNNYPDTKLVTSVTNAGIVSAILNTGEELTFTTTGSFLAYSNNAAEGLSADSLGVCTDSATTDSIHAKHKHGGKGGKHGDKGGKHGNDSIVGGKHGHNHFFENEIAIDSLATEINTFISGNYTGYTVLHAETDTICEGVVTKVLVAIGSTQPIKLYFDITNVYIMKGERIDYTDAPAEVTTSVTTNYGTFSVMKKCEKLTFTDGTIRYKVHLKSTDTHKTVTFNANGTVSCEK